MNIYIGQTKSRICVSRLFLPENACSYILFFEKGRNAAWFSSMHETDNIYNMLFFELCRICTSDPISVLKEVNVICCCLLLSKIIFMYDLWAIISLTKWIRMHSNIYNTENAEIINLG